MDLDITCDTISHLSAKQCVVFMSLSNVTPRIMRDRVQQLQLGRLINREFELTRWMIWTTRLRSYICPEMSMPGSWYVLGLYKNILQGLDDETGPGRPDEAGKQRTHSNHDKFGAGRCIKLGDLISNYPDPKSRKDVPRAGVVVSCGWNGLRSMSLAFSCCCS
jgi:hypothetical protein